MKRKLLVFFIFLIFILTLNYVCADNIEFNQAQEINKITNDKDNIILYEESNEEDNDYDNDDETDLDENLTEDDFIDDDSDEEDDTFDENQTDNESDDEVDENEDELSFLDEIHTNSTSYYKFLSYLIDNEGFYVDINNSDIENNFYIFVSTHNYTFKLYNGENYTLNTGDTYNIYLNERYGYTLGYTYYPDIIYCLGEDYYIDEDYLGWLRWHENYTNIFELDYIETNNTTPTKDYEIEILPYASYGLISHQDLPSSYDLRNYGWVSSLKKQIYGDCWSFASIAALESYLLKLENKTYSFSNIFDFSENNLKNLMSSRGINGYNHTESGTFLMALAYLLRWSGPVNESDDIYNSTNYSYEYSTPLKHVQGAIFISERSNALDNNKIKEAILKYGAVATTMCFIDYRIPIPQYGFNVSISLNDKNYYMNWELYPETANMNSEQCIQHIKNKKIGLHAVAIIGWDDNYSKDNFVTPPEGDGAFIIKDSANQAYYYVSYYDITLGNMRGIYSSMAFTDVENITNYKSIYQHDTIEFTHYIDILSTANRFVSVSNESLGAVGFYTIDEGDYTISVLVNNILKVSKTVTNLYTGYYTIKLDEPIELKEGDNFEIRITEQAYNGKCHTPFEYCNPNSLQSYYNHNQSYYYNGVEWILFSEGNFCIKAYTVFDNEVNESYIEPSSATAEYNSSCLLGYLKSNGIPLTNKNITIYNVEKTNNNNILSTYNCLSDNYGRIFLPVNLNIGTYRMIIEFAGDENHTSTTKGMNVVIKKHPVTITVNSACYYGGNLTVTLKSSNKALTNKKITVKINGNTYQRTSDSSGKINIPLKITNGKYSPKIQFSGDTYYDSTTKNVNFKVNKATVKYTYSSFTTAFNSKRSFNIKVINKKNNQLMTNVKINLKVYTANKFKTYSATTSSDGIAKFAISRLSVGSHKAIISPGNGNINSNKVTTIVKIEKAYPAVKAPKVTNKYNTNSYFKATFTHNTSKKLISNLKVNVKVYTGSNYKTYTLTTNSNGVVSVNTKSLGAGTHKVTISSANSNYVINKSSSILIKK